MLKVFRPNKKKLLLTLVLILLPTFYLVLLGTNSFISAEPEGLPGFMWLIYYPSIPLILLFQGLLRNYSESNAFLHLVPLWFYLAAFYYFLSCLLIYFFGTESHETATTPPRTQESIPNYQDTPKRVVSLRDYSLTFVISALLSIFISRFVIISILKILFPGRFFDYFRGDFGAPGFIVLGILSIFAFIFLATFLTILIGSIYIAVVKKGGWSGAFKFVFATIMIYLSIGIVWFLYETIL